jgi:hypothetical protein
MKNEEILTALVGQAIKGGYDLYDLFPRKSAMTMTIFSWKIVGYSLVVSYHLNNLSYKKHCFVTFSLSDLLFNHPFMEAALKNTELMLFRTVAVLAQIPTPAARLKYVEKNILGV